MSNGMEVNEKVFQHFPILPSEIRMMVIDEMNSKDRCRFAGSSRLCYKQAKSSEKYVHTLELSAVPKTSTLCVLFSDKIDERMVEDGFRLNIMEKSGMKYLKYISLSSYEEVWENEIDSSVDLVEMTIEHFKSLLHFYKNKIKKLVISGSILKNYDFGVDTFKNLEELEIGSFIDANQFISKIRRPLKEFTQRSETEITNVTYFEQIRQVRHRLEIPFLRLNKEQFRQLNASCIHINIGYLTEIDIFNFIKSWQNGEIRDNLRYCKWNFRFSDFNMTTFFRLFGEQYEGLEDVHVNVQHKMEDAKVAQLSYEKQWRTVRDLYFRVIGGRKQNLKGRYVTA